MFVIYGEVLTTALFSAALFCEHALFLCSFFLYGNNHNHGNHLSLENSRCVFYF